MRELPILFSTPMVEAVLAGRKCMTRRTHGLEKVNKNPNEWKFRQWISEVQKPISTESDWRLLAEFENETLGICGLVKAAYAVGDKMWVRERFETDTDGTVKFYAGNIEVKHNAAYRKLTKWRPGIHLFKKDARIWLECTGVRLERLQDISEADAIAEGVLNFNNKPNLWVDYCPQNHYSKEELEDGYPYEPSAAYSFLTLWESTVKPTAWLPDLASDLVVLPPPTRLSVSTNKL